VKFSFTSLALAAVLAEKVWGRLWPIAESGTNPIQRKTKDTKNEFKVFISTPLMVLLPVMGIPRPLIPDQSSSSGISSWRTTITTAAGEDSETKKRNEKYAENIFHLFLKTKNKLILFGLGISDININRFVLQGSGSYLEGVWLWKIGES